jgi:hypothetical protein
MRVLVLRRFAFVALAFALVAGHPARARAQRPTPRSVAVPVEAIPQTLIESLFTEPNIVLVADYYWVDTRFGPNLRIDAMIVEAVDSKTRVKGARVQVRDPESRGRQDGTSYIDLDELIKLSRGLATLMELAPKWTFDERRATESGITTAGGFRLAIRQFARVPRAFLSTGLIDPVVTSIEVADLPTLKQAFDQAIAILNGK